MTTTIPTSDLSALRAHAERDVMVTAGKDHFKVSSSNPFNRLIVWIQTRLLPSSQTRHITAARDRFVAAIGSRYGEDGRAVARDVVGQGVRKPLRSREIREVLGRLDAMSLRRPPPGGTASVQGSERAADTVGPRAPPAGPGLVDSTRAPAPGHATAPANPAFRIQVDPNAQQPAVNGHSPDPVPAGAPFYRELQHDASGLCGMHAMNAFLGGPVIGAQEYKDRSIDIALDGLGVPPEERAQFRDILAKDFASDPSAVHLLLGQLAETGRVGPACARAAAETGVTIPDADTSPEAHAESLERIDAFPGDRLMVGYSGGHGAAAHMVALRRDAGGVWQILDSLKASRVEPKRSERLSECLDALPRGLSIVHVEPGFRFVGEPVEAATRASDPTGGDTVSAGVTADLPPPAFSEGELGVLAAARQPSAPRASDLPPPAFGESELANLAHGQPAEVDLPGPAFEQRELEEMAARTAALAPYLNLGIARAHAGTLQAAGLAPGEAGELMACIAQRGDNPDEALGAPVPLPELRRFYLSGANLGQARLLHGGHLDASIVSRVYAPHRLPIVPESVVRRTDVQVSDPPRRLGSGAFNTTYAVDYNDGSRRIFKPLAAPTGTQPIERGYVAWATGINAYDPQTAMRNLSTCRLAQALGFDVVVDTELGLHAFAPAGAAGAPTSPQLGLVMEFAPGRTGQSCTTAEPAVFDRAAVRRELTKLQLLDGLTAQGDRHPGNYFVDVGPGGRVRVAGIDNDQCFGAKVHHPDAIRRSGPNEPGYGYRGCALPPVVDTEMAAAFERLTPATMGRLLGDKLRPEEVGATGDRLLAIQHHIAELRQQGMVIEPDAWGDGRVAASTNPQNSYFARESAQAAGLVAFRGDLAMALDAMGY